MAKVIDFTTRTLKLESSSPDPILSNAEEERCRKILSQMAPKILDTLEKRNVFQTNPRAKWREVREHVQVAFEAAISRQCNKLIRAAKTKPATIDAINKSNEIRKDARKKLAIELKNARGKLNSLRVQIQSKSEALCRLQDLNASKLYELIERDQSCSIFPRPPIPTVEPTQEGIGLPDGPGIYFFWDTDTDVWAYVGQSVKLSQRVRLGSHHILRTNHQISYLEFSLEELNYAEIVYMALLRPTLNYGGRFYKTPGGHA